MVSDGRVAEETSTRSILQPTSRSSPTTPNPPLRPSGIRIGTPAATARGMKEAEMEKLAEWIDTCLRAPEDDDALGAIKADVVTFCEGFPVPGI